MNKAKCHRVVFIKRADAVAIVNAETLAPGVIVDIIHTDRRRRHVSNIQQTGWVGQNVQPDVQPTPTC